MGEPVSDDGIAVLWSLLSSEDATEREDHDHAKTTTTDRNNKVTRHGAHNKTTTRDHAKTTTTDDDAIAMATRTHGGATERTNADHAKTTTTDHDAITNTNAAKDTQLLSLTTQQIYEMLE